jgi:hypothetical protein
MVPFRPFWAYLGLFGPKRYQTYPAFMAPTTWHPLRCIALVVGTKTKGGILGLILRLHTYGLHALGCLPLFWDTTSNLGGTTLDIGGPCFLVPLVVATKIGRTHTQVVWYPSCVVT